MEGHCEVQGPQIENPDNESIIRPPAKGVIQKSSYNLNARVTQHYNIVEDSSQAPSMMSALKVLQTCPTQQKTLLSSIGAIDHANSSLITIDIESHVRRLSHQIAFQIQVLIKGKTIHQTFIDEGASTCIMSISCWKAIGSPYLN